MSWNMEEQEQHVGKHSTQKITRDHQVGELITTCATRSMTVSNNFDQARCGHIFT